MIFAVGKTFLTHALSSFRMIFALGKTFPGCSHVNGAANPMTHDRLFHVVGLTCVLFVHSLSLHEGITAWNFFVPAIPGMLVGVLAGTLCSAALLPCLQAQGALGYALRFLPGAAAAVLGALALQWQNAWLLALAGACMSLPLAYFLDALVTVRRACGFLLGCVCAATSLLGVFPLLFPGMQDQPSLRTMAMAALGILSGVCAVIPPSSKKEPHDTRPYLEKKWAWETLAYLTGIALTFFLLNAVMDWVFYRMHARDFPIPAEVHLYIWAVCPLVGFWLDRRGTDARLFLACLACVIMMPLLVLTVDGSFIYWCIYAVCLSVRDIALVYLLLVFGKFRQTSGLAPGLVLCLPWLCFLLSYTVIRNFLQIFPGIIPFFCLMWVLTAGFSFLASRVQYALTLSGAIPLASPPKERPSPPDSTEATAVVEQRPTASSSADPEQEASPHTSVAPEELALENAYSPVDFGRFSQKYGISKREQDVLALIVVGKDTAAMAQLLHISESTVKSHVRQILRKTESRNRIVLSALFFRESKYRKKA